MSKLLPIVAAAVILHAGGALAAGRQLAHCADASPEGFDPSRWDGSSTDGAGRE